MSVVEISSTIIYVEFYLNILNMKDKMNIQEKEEEIEINIRKKKEDLKIEILQKREHFAKYKKAYRELMRIGARNFKEKQVERYIEYCDQRNQARSALNWQMIVHWKSKIYHDLCLHENARNLENYLEKNISDEEALCDLRRRNTKSLVRSLANREEEMVTDDIRARCYLQTLLLESNNESIAKEIERNIPYINWSVGNAKFTLNLVKHLRVHKSTLKYLETTTKERYYQAFSFARLLLRYKEIARENGFDYKFDKEKYLELNRIQERVTEKIKKEVQSPDQFIRSLQEVEI